ncbi:hypothetical protein [Flavihumibacter petaseus]|uniref:Uncharacterized protein n=1 Tax=Flavihumibacter petaseus NBRC 106054 TaxID=1220578 RepID=A0A0E9N259_9BACT|nr:hypothetical protein [Flavihumibacter petaseus]GAO44117.1 hypothetical protein FPE01S_03_01560 [Flavihumibacter petaseus NBRC 106054]
MKKYITGIAAVVMAASLSAFTYAPAKNGRSTNTYHYVGNLYTDAEYNNEQNWEKGGTNCGAVGTKMCTIVAPDDGSDNPDFSALPGGGNVRTDNTIIFSKVFKQ